MVINYEKLTKVVDRKNRSIINIFIQMKILVILTSLTVGGAENYTVGLMNQFVQAGHHVKLVVLSNELSLKDRLSSMVELLVLPRKFKLDISVLLKIQKEVETGGYDAVISSYIIYQKLAMILSKSNVITLYPIHSTIPRTWKGHFFRKIVFKIRAKNEIFLTSIDGQTKYLLNAYNLPPNYFEQILNGIDTNYFTLCPDDFNKRIFLTEIGVPSENRIILMVAGFREEKRHVDALLAFKMLKVSYPRVTLVCVGNNDVTSKQYLEAFVNDNDIENVLLLSASEAGEVRNYYWACDLFTLTSDKVETFSISALEALACGKPCVLTDIGGASDFISEMNNGCLVKPNNIESIKEGWLKVLNNLDSFNKYEIREKVVQNYSIQTSAKKYIELIESKKL